jgi:hypothetical protein
LRLRMREYSQRKSEGGSKLPHSKAPFGRGLAKTMRHWKRTTAPPEAEPTPAIGLKPNDGFSKIKLRTNKDDCATDLRVHRLQTLMQRKERICFRRTR